MCQQVVRKQFVKRETFIQQKDRIGGFPAIFRYCPQNMMRIGGKVSLSAYWLVY